MHELPIISDLFETCMYHAELNHATRIVSVTLKIGDATDLQDEWMQRYFDYMCKNTIAAGATLKIEREPFIVRCQTCSETLQVNLHEQQQPECPRCQGKKLDYVSGRVFKVECMEIV